MVETPVNDLSHCHIRKTPLEYTSLLYQYQNIYLYYYYCCYYYCYCYYCYCYYLLLLPLLLLTIHIVVNMLYLIMYIIYFNIFHIISRHVSYPVGVAHPPTKNPRLNRPMDVAFSSTVDATRHLCCAKLTQITQLPSGKHTKKYGKSSFLMGKSTINHHFL